MPAASAHHCTCPQARRTYTHKADMNWMQKTPEFKQMKKDHALVPGATCAHCGREHGQVRINWRTQEEQLDKNGHIQITHLTINHKYPYLSLSPSLYLKWDPVTMEVCCMICNGHYRKGMEICPVCGINPIQKDEPGGKGMCNPCFIALHPEIQEERDARKEKWDAGVKERRAIQNKKRLAKKVRHPCRHHRIGGKCGKSSIDSRCTFARTKALKPAPVGCAQAEAKKGVTE